MKQLFLIAVAALLLVACSSGTEPQVVQSALAQAPAAKTVKTKFSAADASGIPVEIRIPSAVGEVTFLHQLHIKDRNIACVECHHQIDAKKLETPHPEYLDSSWINCKICHRDAPKAAQKPVFTCSECHHATPASLADETLSAKVVVHRQCWKCHQVGTGPDASQGCILCHSGEKSL